MAQIQTLWHEDFRQNLMHYGYENTDDPNLFYTEGQGVLYLCPDMEELLYTPVASYHNQRIIDYTDDHLKAKEMFHALINELKEKGRLKEIHWSAHPYYWRAKTSAGINLRPGRLDGRPEQPKAIPINDDIVHGVIVGRTGSGKSVLLNHLLVTLMDEYAPWELSLYIVDMKKVEFGAFMSKGHEAAHIRVCAATSEVRYVLSMLRHLERSMQLRQNLFTAIGYKKIADFRADNPDLALPRIAIVVDEFQQLFLNAVGRESTEILRLIGSITRLGRATGVHLLFASQEMSGTGISGLLGNFKLRIALPCDAGVSSDILGNSGASVLEKGYALVNCAGGDEKENMLFQVPFVDKPKEHGAEGELSLENDYLQGHLQYVRNRAIQTGFFNGYVQKFYQEDLQNDIAFFEKSILPRLNGSRHKMGSNGKFMESLVLGNSVLYNGNPIDLESLCIEAGKNQNICVVAPDAEDLVYLQKLFVDNLATSAHTVQNGGSGVTLKCFSFDPVLTSYYNMEEDPVLKEGEVHIEIKDDSDIPKLICELHLRRILFKYLQNYKEQDPRAFFFMVSTEFIQALNATQIRDREHKLLIYNTESLMAIQQNLEEEIRSFKTPDEILEFCKNRKLKVSDVSGKPPVETARHKKEVSSPKKPAIGINLGGKFGPAAVKNMMNARQDTSAAFSTTFSKNSGAPQDANSTTKTEHNPEGAESTDKQTNNLNGSESKASDTTLVSIKSEEEKQAATSLNWLLKILEHFARSWKGEPVKQQFPLNVVMMSNANLSEALNASSSKRNDIRILHEELMPLGPTYQTLFIYLFSEADNNSAPRSSFNYFFVCGNREKDYDFCRMRYTNKMPGSIVVDCRIHSKNVERSFKKYRWTLAEPEAETLDLTNLADLYGEPQDELVESVEEDEYTPEIVLPTGEKEDPNDMFFFI